MIYLCTQLCRLKIRVGIHTGSLVGGVVGVKIPHYSIFGEAVDMAGIMEQTSQPMKIHMSESTSQLLSEVGGFNFISRGIVDLPKVGEKHTFWLVGRKDQDNIKKE
ncbi:guanylate cyclase 2G [Eurytemora carolleeae]|uniref:guanylate cyclase 2G n=1 Tax=Eurytemora carolleeae TaxID=1294199 RepID=UPI000C76112E|nr:guanylate cyclase 2G [Eurytemora carolleeae]|eukprot:XP_023346967.1 guanylate cyclase 2G-like [Eurytemora affinis]